MLNCSSMPDEINAVAAVSANLPTPDNLDCITSGKQISMLIMNGTNDPLNPYQEGKVALFGFGNRGTVRSSIEYAKYFAALAGYNQTPNETLTRPHHIQPDATSTRQDMWRANEKPEIVLYLIINGGTPCPPVDILCTATARRNNN